MSTEDMDSVMEENYQPEHEAQGYDEAQQSSGTEYQPPEPEATPEVTPSQEPSSDAQPAPDDELYMPEFGSDEYYEKFNSLPYKDQVKVERGEFKFDKDKEEAPAEEVVNEEDVKPLPGDAPKKPEEEAAKPELGWDEDNFEKLDDHTKNTVREMQDQIDKYSEYDKPEYKALLDVINKDPAIQARLMELKGQDINEIPGQLKQEYNPGNYVNQQIIDQLDFDTDPETAQAALGQIMRNVYQDAVNKTNVANQYSNQRSIHEVELKNQVSKQVDDLISSNESYKSELAITDTAHPLNPFMSWVRDSTSNEMIQQFGISGLHAVYMEQNGGRDAMIKNVQSQTRQRFIRSIDKAKDQLRTVGRETQTRDVSQTNNTDGIDLNRYMADDAYAHMQYDNASWAVQQKLEKFVTTGDYPAR